MSFDIMSICCPNLAQCAVYTELIFFHPKKIKLCAHISNIHLNVQFYSHNIQASSESPLIRVFFSNSRRNEGGNKEPADPIDESEAGDDDEKDPPEPENSKIILVEQIVGQDTQMHCWFAVGH